MDNLKNVSISVAVSVVVAVLAIVTSLTFLNRPIEQVSIPPAQLGAMPGNQIEGQYFTIGGVEYAHVRMANDATSSVPCMTKNPFSATSTLVSFTARFTQTPTDQAAYNQDMDIATSSSSDFWPGSATSSQSIVNDVKLPSNGSKLITWNNNSVTGAAHNYFKPGDYLGAKMATNTPGVDYFTGVCTAVFQKL